MPETTTLAPPSAPIPKTAYQSWLEMEDGSVIPHLSAKGYEVFNCYQRQVLVHGPRLAGKTLALCNRLLRHCFEVDGAVCAVVCKSLKNGKQGVWRDLCHFVLPGWVEAGIGLRVTGGPKMDPSTHMHFFTLATDRGTTAEVQLHSLDHDEHVWQKFKGTRFSFVWISEADQFDNVDVLNGLLDQLRMLHLGDGEHHLFADCNPPEDGEDHWLYDAFFRAKEKRRDYYQRCAEIGFSLDDNPFLEPDAKAELVERYRHDRLKYARFIEGEWVKDTSVGWFDEFFIRNIVEIGDCSSPDESEHHVIVPDKTCTMLLTGTDLGQTNHAIGFWWPMTTAEGEVSYAAIDEIVCLQQPVSVDELTDVMLTKIKYWDAVVTGIAGKPPVWRHWGDSSLHNYRAVTNSNEARQIFQRTGGKIFIQPVTKGQHSIRGRIGLVQRLLHSNRLFVSANCPYTLDWLLHLKKGKHKNEPVPLGSKQKHKFDADSYIFMSELPFELERRAGPPVATMNVSL